jgi:hypothetical protein
MTEIPYRLSQSRSYCDATEDDLRHPSPFPGSRADIIETNTFGATRIAQSEFFVDDPRETIRAVRS